MTHRTMSEGIQRCYDSQTKLTETKYSTGPADEWSD